MTSSIEQALRCFEPAVRQPTVGPGYLDGDVGFTVDDTGLGRMLFAVRHDGPVVASAFVEADADTDRVLTRISAMVSPRVLRMPARTDAVRRQLSEYLDGRRQRFDLPVDLALAGAFQGEVLHHLVATTGYGQRTTYGALAVAVGRPRAARAVGAALGGNPLCVVLPCHRVNAASGALTGYAGGLAAKQLLLDLESRPA
ncbi:MAG: methylated-DNA--[protein]-cysteine S-methyltransferase [Angustibacter sp.]